MRRAFAFVIALLAGCNAAARTQPSQSAVHGAAYIDVQRALRSDPLFGALAGDDAQIAALSASIASAPLTGTSAQRHERSAQLDRELDAANRAALRLRSGAAAYAPGAQAFDAAALQARIEATYGAQSTMVRDRAQSSQDAYARSLDAQQQAQIRALQDALNRRVSQAYALRAQSLRERESNRAFRREEGVADRQAVLRAKAAAALPDARRGYDGELATIARTLAARSAADRQADAATLRAYAASLRSAATSEYARTVGELTAKDAANLRLRQRVTDAQLGAPVALDRSYAQSMARDGQTLQRYARTGQPLPPAFSAARTQIGTTIAGVQSTDDAERARAVSELHALRAARAALYARLVASVEREGRAIASSRGLVLVPRRDGAVDVTGDVARALEKKYGS